MRDYLFVAIVCVVWVEVWCAGASVGVGACADIYTSFREMCDWLMFTVWQDQV